MNVVCVRNSVHRMPQNAHGIAIRMISGSSQLWKFTAISRYTSPIAKIMPNPSRVNESFIVSTWPRSSSCVAFETF